MIVRCLVNTPLDEVDEIQYVDLTVLNCYSVIEETKYDYILIGDEGSPYYYSKRRFEVVDGKKDDDWVEDETGHLLPSLFISNLYILEDYHDHIPEAIDKLEQYLIGRFTYNVGKPECARFYSEARDIYGEVE